MSERDAFGREKGEDPLAGMGWSSSVDPNTPTPTPTPAPAQPVPVMQTLSADDLPPSAPAPAWTPGPRQTYVRRRRRRVSGIIVPLFIIGIVALAIGGATTALNAGSDALDDFTASIDSATNGGTVTTTTTPSDGTTLMQPKALKAALAKLPDGDIELLRVAPERINANVIVKGRMHVVQVTAGGDVTDVTTPAKGRGDYVKVNSAAPSRIARTAAKRSGRRVGRVSYLVLMSLSGKAEWQLFFDDGMHYSASANGKKVKRVG
jgi:hypothetical protein